MNILVFHFKESFQIELLNRIIANRPNDTFYLFWESPGLEKRPNVIDKSTDFLTLLTGKELSFKFSELLPLDNSTLVKLSPYEYMSKRILQRYVTLGYLNKFFRRPRKGLLSVMDSIHTTLGDNASSFVLSFDELHNHYMNFLRYWVDFYAKNKVDCILADQLPHNGLDYISYAVSLNYKVRYVFGHFIPIWGNQVFYDGFTVEQRFLDALSKNKQVYSNKTVVFDSDFQQEINKIRGINNETKYGHWAGDFKLHKKLWDELSEWKQKILTSHVEKIGKHDFQDSFFYRILNYIIFKSMSLFVPKKKYEASLQALISSLAVTPDLSKKYIYFPLHYQSEASSQPLGGYYERQLLIIEQLSSLSEMGYMVYVKEHNKISTPTNRDALFYKRIKSLSNTILVNDKYSSIELINNSIAVATISGTAGWEAFVIGKAILLFGFNLLVAAEKGVYKIDSSEDLNSAIDDIFNRYKPDYPYIDIFLKTIEETYPKVATERYVFMRSNITLDDWCETLEREFLKRLN